MDHRLRRWVDVGPGEIYFLGQVLKDELTLSAPLHTQTELLEGQWVDMVQRPSVAIRSCSDAIFLALHALGIGECDKVMVPAYVFSETIEPVTRMGATPIFVDVDDYGNLDVESAARIWKKHPDIKAVIVPHMHGCPTEMQDLMDFFYPKEVWVIEDCRYATGVTYKGKKVGTFGVAGCWSFAERPLTAGGGGMLSGDKTLIDHVRQTIEFDSDRKVVEIPGHDTTTMNHLMQYKPDSDYRMPGVTAAIVRGMLIHRTEYNNANKLAKRLIEKLYYLPEVYVPHYMEEHLYHQFMVKMKDPGLRAVLTTALAREGVPIMQWGFRPVANYPAYNSDPDDWPVAAKLYEEQFMLFNNTYPLISATAEIVDWVAETFIRVLKEIKAYA